MKSNLLKAINNYDGPIGWAFLSNFKSERLYVALMIARKNAINEVEETESTRILCTQKYAALCSFLRKKGYDV
jgi:hypothetical protein